MRISRFCVVCVLAATTWANHGLAETYTVGPKDNWFRYLSANHLQPGDQLVLQEGVYTDPRRLVLTCRGSQNKPIRIRAATGQRVVFRRPDAKQNTMNLQGCQHLVLSGIEITGGAAAIRMGPDRMGNQCGDIVLEDLYIHHIGGEAVTCNFEGAEYQRMRFSRNHIHHTAGHGEAFYLGANEGKAVFANSIIEDNYIHHLNGRDISQGDGIELKQGSYGNRVSGNVIHDTNYPGVTVYGTAGQARNVIENNVIWKTGDHGIQAAADAVIRGNWIALTGGCGIYSREHQGARPGNLQIEKNVVFAQKNPALRLIGTGQRAEGIELRGNRLMGTADGITVRVDQMEPITAEDNTGVGRIQGSQAIQADWTAAKILSVDLPELPNNPAWKFLRPAEVRANFAHP